MASAHECPALAQEGPSLPLPTAGAECGTCGVGEAARAPPEPLWLLPVQVPSPSRVINASCHTTSGNKSLLLSSPDEKDVAMEIGDCITALPHAMFFFLLRSIYDVGFFLKEQMHQKKPKPAG